MPYICRNYTYVANSINELCRHLRITHSLYEGSQLNLKCCFLNCPSIFKTYSGFRKHLAKCKLNIETVCTIDNSNNLTEIPLNCNYNIEENLNKNNNNESNTNTHKDVSTNNFRDHTNLEISEDINNKLGNLIRRL